MKWLQYHAGRLVTGDLDRRLRLTAAVCLFVIVPGFSLPAFADRVLEGLSRDRLQRLDAMAGSYVEQGRLPGATLAVARNGQVVKNDTVGAVADDSIFRIYSMTKPITAVAVLLLFEEGRLLLTDPVAQYLPEFSAMQVISGVNADGSVQTRPAQNVMTIKHLLTHTAGLSYDDETAAGLPLLYHQADIWSASSLAAFSQKIASLPLVFEPGTRWHYSVAQDVLGRLVEVVAGQPFDQFMQQRILGPLGMDDTGFWVPEDRIDRFLPLYGKQDDGMKLVDAPGESRYLNPRRVPYGGGGLVSTAVDYLRFAQMLANGGELDGQRLLSRKTVDLMMMNQLSGTIESLHVDDAWLSNTENRSGDMHLGLGYGLGGYVFTDIADNAVPGSVGTYGWGGNGSTYFFVDRQENLVGLFLTQLSPSSSYPLRAQFRALVYQALVD